MTNQNIQAMLNQYEKSKVSQQTKIREVLQQTALLGLERSGFFLKKRLSMGGRPCEFCMD